jgi:hypothetical protein
LLMMLLNYCIDGVIRPSMTINNTEKESQPSNSSRRSTNHDTRKPESLLKKKSNIVCHHTICESVAMGESLVAHVSTHYG